MGGGPLFICNYGFMHHCALMIILNWICQDVGSVSKILLRWSAGLVCALCTHLSVLEASFLLSHPCLSHPAAYLRVMKAFVTSTVRLMKIQPQEPLPNAC